MSEGSSGMANTIPPSLIMPKSQNLDSANAPDLARAGSGLSRRRRLLSPEKQSVQSTHLSPPVPQVATVSPPVGQFLINTLLQVAGFVAAISFGIYAVRSVTVGNDANKYARQAVLQAVTANQLTLLAMCLSTGNQTGDIASICSRVVSGAASVLPNAASMLFTPLPTLASTASTTSQTSTSTSLTSITPTPTPSSIPTSSSSSIAAPIVGAIVGAVVGVILLLSICCTTIWYRRRRYAGAAAPTTATPGAPDIEADTPLSKSKGIVKVFRKVFVDSRVTTQME